MAGSKERIDHIDRRRYIRLYQDFACEYVLFDCEKTSPVSEKKTCVINNISAVGVLLLIAEEISEECKDFLYSGRFKILLEIRLPEVKPIMALAKIIWLSREAQDTKPKYGLGLEFMDISTQSQDAIIDFVLKTLLGQSGKNTEGRIDGK